MTVSVQRRMTNGLYFRLAYTYAHAIDDGQDALVAGRPVVVQNSYSRERRAWIQRHGPASSLRSVLGRTPRPFDRDHPMLETLFNNWKFSGVITVGSGRPVDARMYGDPNQDGNTSNDRLPGYGRNAFVGPDYATTDMRVTRRLFTRDRLKLDLIVESFNLFNRDNQRVQITDDGFLNSAGQFVQVDKRIGVNYFPAQYQIPSNFTEGHRRLCTPPGANGLEIGFLVLIVPVLRQFCAMYVQMSPQYRLTCFANLAITNGVQMGRVWGCSTVGRSQNSRGRVPRKCLAPFQAQSATGRHHQGGQASLLLPEAGREKARKRSAGSQTQPQESSQGTRLAVLGRSLPRRRPIALSVAPAWDVGIFVISQFSVQASTPRLCAETVAGRIQGLISGAN